MRRVVVTGMGAITPLGLNVKEYFDNIKAGNHGFGIISKFDVCLSEYIFNGYFEWVQVPDPPWQLEIGV